MVKINFMNIKIDNLTMDEAIRSMDCLIKIKKNSYVVTPNIDHIVNLETDNEFKEVYKNANLVLTDGKPLIWISRFYNTPIKEKVSGSDIFPRLCELSSEKGYGIFLLGAAEGVAEKAKKNLIEEYPNLRIVGTLSPKFGFEKSPKEIDKIIKAVKKARPEILVVGLGAPKQEKFIYKYRHRMEVPLALGLGASIDFEAGNIKRAPIWIQKFGFEWLYRIFQDPRRLFKRYCYDIVKILPLVFKYKNER
jgi:exopolysaccharide biosynthesis WecB/TagA/CpsF family protein